MASEKRLIDANALANKFLLMPGHYRKAEIDLIDSAPTVDAVEVVRCKDCKHYKPQSKSVKWHNETPYCCRCTTVKVEPDSYCSYGERKI